MIERDEVAWNVLIIVCMQTGFSSRVFQSLRENARDNVVINFGVGRWNNLEFMKLLPVSLVSSSPLVGFFKIFLAKPNSKDDGLVTMALEKSLSCRI